MRRILKIIVAAAILLGGLQGLGTASKVSADVPEATFLLAPDKNARNGLGYYQDDVKLGETREYKFYVKNLKDEPIEISMYPADVKPLQNGGKGFSASNEGVSMAGSWIYPQDVKKVKLKPEELREFTYQVKVPNELEPGQYIGTIAAVQYVDGESNKIEMKEATLLQDVEEGLGIQIVMNYKKEQSTHGMSINTFSHDYVNGLSQFTITLENKGTILERPTGYVELRTLGKEVLYREEYEAGSIYPKTTANMVYMLHDMVLMPDEYEVYYEANFNGQKEWKIFRFTVTAAENTAAIERLEEDGKIEVSAIPLWIKIGIAVLLLLVLLLLLLLLFLILRRKKEDVEALIRKYLSKGYTFLDTRKKVKLEEEPFKGYLIRMGIYQEGEEVLWECTLEELQKKREDIKKEEEAAATDEETKEEDIDVEVES